jgi:drug/metabolite transporter (DMT)-like permease
VRSILEKCFANAWLLLTVTAFFWAGNAIAGKLAVGLMTPITLTFLRWSVAALVILIVARRHLRRDLAAILRHWPLLFAFGALGFAAFNLLLYSALNYTTAINVTIEQSAMPVLIMLINYLAFRQQIGAVQCIGVAMTIAGVIVTAAHGDIGSIIESGINRGDAIMIAVVLLYSGYAVALRYKPAVHGLSLMAAMCISAWLFTLPFFAFQTFNQGFELPGIRAWMIVLYAAILPAVLSQLLFMRGVELIGSNRAGVFINLVPIFGALLAVALLGEAFESYHLLGLLLVLGGIAIAERCATHH